MKLKFALVLFVLLFGAIAVDEVLGGDDKHTSTPASTEGPVEPTTPSISTIKPTTPDPGPVPDELKDYMLTFVSYGLNMTGDNLFNYALKKTQTLKPIFNYTKGTEENFAKVEIKPIFPSIEIDLYLHEPNLNELLNATKAVFYPGNYSYQLYHSTHYGRVSADSFLSVQKYKATLQEIEKEFFTEEFIKDAVKLSESTDYHWFIVKYGSYIFKNAWFGGMLRMQSHVTHKYVKDVSEEGFKKYLKVQLRKTVGILETDDEPNSYDFFYHNHYDNSTFGGNKTANVSAPDGGSDWLKSFITPTEIVPISIGFTPITNLMNVSGLMPPGANVSKIMDIMDKTIYNELNKFKVQSYMEAMDVVRNNPYGRSLGGSFDAQFLYSYFEGKLKETTVTLDEEFYDNAWAAEHNAQAILNRRAWFEKPYPPEPTTLAPTTEPTKPANATEAAATTEATTKKA